MGAIKCQSRGSPGIIMYTYIDERTCALAYVFHVQLHRKGKKEMMRCNIFYYILIP